MPSPCPQPGKSKYPTKNAAISAAIHLSSQTGRKVKTYRCACGKWHMSTKKPKA